MSHHRKRFPGDFIVALMGLLEEILQGPELDVQIVVHFHLVLLLLYSLLHNGVQAGNGDLHPFEQNFIPVCIFINNVHLVLRVVIDPIVCLVQRDVVIVELGHDVQPGALGKWEVI